MASANEADLLRVFTSVPPANVAQDHIPQNTAFNVVVEAEVGQALFNTGGAYRVNVVLLDITAGTTFPQPQQNGTFGSGTWPGLNQTFTFNIAGQPAVDHIIQAIAVLVAGIQNPIVEFEESDMAIVV